MADEDVKDTSAEPEVAPETTEDESVEETPDAEAAEAVAAPEAADDAETQPEAAAEPEAAEEPDVETEGAATEETAEVEAAVAPAEEMPAKPKRKRLPRALRPKKTRPKRVRSTERKPIVRLEKPPGERGRRQERQGTVVSDAMEKTIVVEVTVVKAHPRYKKVVRRSVKFHAHDERSEAKVGDVVRIVETRPLSKTKRWRLVEILEVAK
jgi:small subunit ribosomal protein S17